MVSLPPLPHAPSLPAIFSDHGGPRCSTCFPSATSRHGQRARSSSAAPRAAGATGAAGAESQRPRRESARRVRRADQSTERRWPFGGNFFLFHPHSQSTRIQRGASAIIPRGGWLVRRQLRQRGAVDDPLLVVEVLVRGSAVAWAFEPLPPVHLSHLLVQHPLLVPLPAPRKGTGQASSREGARPQREQRLPACICLCRAMLSSCSAFSWIACPRAVVGSGSSQTHDKSDRK